MSSGKIIPTPELLAEEKQGPKSPDSRAAFAKIVAQFAKFQGLATTPSILAVARRRT